MYYQIAKIIHEICGLVVVLAFNIANFELLLLNEFL